MQDSQSGSLWSAAHLGLPMALRVAATLRLADLVRSGTTRVADLAERTGTDPDALARLVRFLSRRGVLSLDADLVGLGERGHEILDDHPSGLRGHLDMTTVFGEAELAFVDLMHSVRTGTAAYPQRFGRTLWESLAAEPDLAESFHASMRTSLPDRWRALAECLDWSRFGQVYDIGGGDGSLLRALTGLHGEVAGVVVDRAEAIDQAVGLGEERITFVEGDFLSAVPAGADAYVLNLVLHNWDDPTASEILRRCAEGLNPGGRVLVVERFGADGRSAHTGMDLRMLAYFGGKERDLDDLVELAGRAGLTLVASHPAGRLRVVELGRRAQPTGLVA